VINLLDVLENFFDHGKPGLDLRERRAEGGEGRRRSRLPSCEHDETPVHRPAPN